METLAGFLLGELGHIPMTGESVRHAGQVFRVAEMAGRRISRVRVEGTVRASALDDQSATEDDGLEVSA